MKYIMKYINKQTNEYDYLWKLIIVPPVCASSIKKIKIDNENTCESMEKNKK